MLSTDITLNQHLMVSLIYIRDAVYDSCEYIAAAAAEEAALNQSTSY